MNGVRFLLTRDQNFMYTVLIKVWGSLILVDGRQEPHHEFTSHSAAKERRTASYKTTAAPPENAGPPDHAGPPSSAPAPSHAGPPEHAGPPASTPTPTPTPTEPTEEPGQSWKTETFYNLTFDVPSDWEIVANCEYECSAECTSYNVWDSEGVPVMNFETTSFRDADGDTNTYRREVLDNSALTQLQFAPNSMVSYYWVASGGAQDLTVAVIIDDEWKNWKETSTRDYFKTEEERWPTMQMHPDYLQALGYDQDGDTTLDEANEFLASEQYSTLKKVMTSARESQ